VQHQSEYFVELPDGTQLWVATSDEGPPVVCCQGGPGLWDYLGDLADLLDDSHLVVRFDQRGCGRSTTTDGPFTVAQAVDDLERLRQAMGVERWAVLGHSWGAELACGRGPRTPSAPWPSPTWPASEREKRGASRTSSSGTVGSAPS